MPKKLRLYYKKRRKLLISSMKPAIITTRRYFSCMNSRRTIYESNNVSWMNWKLISMNAVEGHKSVKKNLNN